MTDGMFARCVSATMVKYRYTGPETNEEVMAEASKGLLAGVKLTIEYVCSIGSLNAEHILDELRSYGAADIKKIEPLSKKELEDWGLG